MMDDEYSSDAEEKMLEYDHIDYSKFLKPNPKATIHIGERFQAKLPEISEDKIKREQKELEKFMKEIQQTDKMKKHKNKTNSKIKVNKTQEERKQTDHFVKKRKIEEK